MPRALKTFPQVFAEAGYRTANFGKIHVPQELHHWQHHDPTGAGMKPIMDRADDSLAVRGPIVPTYLGGRMREGEAYPPDEMFDGAERWLNKETAESDRPFLLRVSVLQPHTPVVPPLGWAGRYAGLLDGEARPRPEAPVFESTFGQALGGHLMTPEQIAFARQCYYELVGWIDQRVGTLLSALEATGKRENTIIVFDADHGAGLGEGHRWAKHVFAPEVHRVPRLISWPGSVAAGKREAKITQGIDLARTLADLCGVTLPGQFQGKNVLGDEAHEFVISEIGFGDAPSRAFPNLGAGPWPDGRGWPRRACVRTNQHRLDMSVRQEGKSVSAEQADVFLADVVNDPAELLNLANDPAHSETKKQLQAQLLESIADSVECPCMADVYKRMG